jgi:CRP-like cAMP-binding protein
MSQHAGDHQTNRLLASLDPKDFRWLEPNLEVVDLRRRMVLPMRGHSLRYIYFPHNAVVSLCLVLHDGRAVEVAMFGREALIGLTFAGVPLESYGTYFVQVPGTASRIDQKRMQEAVTARPQIQQMVLRYTELLMALTLQSVACNAAHSVEARCCRHLLRLHDRINQDRLPLTHEALASMLGVQRSTVSAMTRTLQVAGLIRQGRGIITVIDRPGLEANTCECYEATREKVEQLAHGAYYQGNS